MLANFWMIWKCSRWCKWILLLWFSMLRDGFGSPTTLQFEGTIITLSRVQPAVYTTCKVNLCLAPLCAYVCTASMFHW
jgi:hypothetical protein